MISATVAANLAHRPSERLARKVLGDSRPVWVNRPHSPIPGGVPLDAFRNTEVRVLEGIKTLVSLGRRVIPYIGTYKAGTKKQIADVDVILTECRRWHDFGCAGVALDSLAKLGRDVYDQIRLRLPPQFALVGEAFYGYGPDQRLQIMLDRKFAALPEPPFANRSTLNLSFIWLKKRNPQLEERALLRGAQLVCSPSIL